MVAAQMVSRVNGWRRGVGFAALTAALVCAGAAGQPEQPPASPAASGGEAAPQNVATPPPRRGNERQDLRARLQRRMELMRRTQERMERALAMLDRGDPLEDVQREAAEQPIWGEGGGPGGPGNGDPRFPGAGPGDGGERERGERGERMRDRGGIAGPLTDEDKLAVREILAATAPVMLRRLTMLEEKDPPEAAKRYAEAFPRVRELMDLKAKDPEVYALRLGEMKHGREAQEAARWLVEHERTGVITDPKERAEQTERLVSAISAQLDIRRKLQERDATMLESRLKTVRDELATQVDADRERVVERLARGMLERTRERMRKESEGNGRMPQPGRGPDQRRPLERRPQGGPP